MNSAAVKGGSVDTLDIKNPMQTRKLIIKSKGKTPINKFINQNRSNSISMPQFQNNT
jgi:hypothetical protein